MSQWTERRSTLCAKHAAQQRQQSGDVLSVNRASEPKKESLSPRATWTTSSYAVTTASHSNQINSSILQCWPADEPWLHYFYAPLSFSDELCLLVLKKKSPPDKRNKWYLECISMQKSHRSWANLLQLWRNILPAVMRLMFAKKWLNCFT